ncbi:MAG: mannonate dehydratase, partial [Candidatus Latescibacterota bacterium]
MKRRRFGQVIAGSAVGAGLASSRKLDAISAHAAPVPRKNLLMHVGGDYHSVAGGGITSKKNLEYNLRHGVRHLMAQVGKSTSEGAWDIDELKMMKDNCDKHGVIFEGIRMDSSYIMLKNGPERDRKIEIIQGNIQKASQVGVKVISYHWTVI